MSYLEQEAPGTVTPAGASGTSRPHRARRRRARPPTHDGPEGGPIALDPWQGTVLWQTTLPAFSFAAPAVAKDAIAVPGSDGTLRLLAPATGTLLAELPLAEPSSGAPSVTDATLLVGTGAGAFLPGDSPVCFGR